MSRHLSRRLASTLRSCADLDQAAENHADQAQREGVVLVVEPLGPVGAFPPAGFVEGVLVDHVAAVLKLEIVFPEVPHRQQIGVDFAGVVQVVRMKIAHEHVGAGEGRVALLAPEHVAVAGLGAGFPAVEHRGAKAFGSQPHFVVHAAAVEDLAGVLAARFHVGQDRGVVGRGDGDVVRGIEPPEGRLLVVVRVVVAVPFGTVGGGPDAVEARGELGIAAARGHDVLGAVVMLLDQFIAGLNEGFRPEVAPPFPVRPRSVSNDFSSLAVARPTVRLEYSAAS